MTKYIVGIFLPGIDVHYDAYLPAGKTIGEATELLKSIITSLSNGDYKGTKDSVLLNAESGEPYDPNITVYDSGIRNSTQLILI